MDMDKHDARARIEEAYYPLVDSLISRIKAEEELKEAEEDLKAKEEALTKCLREVANETSEYEAAYLYCDTVAAEAQMSNNLSAQNADWLAKSARELGETIKKMAKHIEN